MKNLRIIVNILMILITFSLMSFNFVSPLYHEIFGIVISILIILHLILNIKWITNVTKYFKRVNRKAKILYIVDILTFLSYLFTILIGILISIFIFNFETSYNPYLMLTHHILGRVSLIFMLIHFGFHLKEIVNKITKDETIKSIIYILYITISFIICIYLIHTLLESYIWQSLM